MPGPMRRLGHAVFLEEGSLKAKASRIMWFVVGVLLSSFGIALITKAAWGTSPVSTIPYVLSDRFPLTYGEFTFICNTLFVIGQFVLLGRACRPIQILQMGVNLIFSFGIDASMMLLSWIDVSPVAVDALLVVLGCASLAFGISLEVASDVLFVPGDGMARAIAIRLGADFGKVKVCFDVSLVAIAAVLSLIFFFHLDGLGLGTIVSALAVGRLVTIFTQHVPLVGYVAALKERAGSKAVTEGA